MIQYTFYSKISFKLATLYCTRWITPAGKDMGTWNLDFCQQRADHSYSDSMLSLELTLHLKFLHVNGKD